MVVDATASDLIALACMPEPRTKIFLRVPPVVKDEWKKTVTALRTDQTKLGEALVRWFLRQERRKQFDVMVEEGTSQARPGRGRPKRRVGGVVHNGGKNLREADKP